MNWRFDRRLLGEVWGLAWPTVVYSVLDSLLGLADIYMVGKLKDIGTEAMAAVGFAQQVLMLVSVGALAVSTGTITLVAQAMGAKDRKVAGRVAGQSLLSMCALGSVVAVPGVLLSRWFLELMGAGGVVLQEGSAYLKLLLGASPLMMINFALAATFRGSGDTMTPLKIALTFNGVNVLGNWLFIFGVGPFPRLGVAGAAVGTIIGRSVGAAVGVTILLRGHHRVHCRFGGSAGWVDLPLVRRMLNVGLPAAAQGLFRNGARVLFFTVVAGSVFHAAAAAALTVGQRVILITQMPSLAFQVAAAALVGQSIGAKDWKQAEGYGWETVKLCGVIMAAMAAVQWLASTVIMSIFTKDEQVVALGVTVLRYFAVAQIFSSIAITSAGGLVGAGDTRPALYYTILGQWVVMLPLAWLLMRVGGLDPQGAWLAWTAAQVVQMVLTLQRFRSGKWKEVRVWGAPGPRELASEVVSAPDEGG